MLKRSAVDNFFIFYNKLDDLIMNAELIEEIKEKQIRIKKRTHMRPDTQKVKVLLNNKADVFIS